MRVMVTGSRGWKDYSAVLERLRALPDGTTVMHGGAWGADACADDALAELYFQEARDLEVERHFPDATRPSPQRYHERNDAMLDRAGLVLAFWDGKSRGTASVIRKAKERGIPVEVVGGAAE